MQYNKNAIVVSERFFITVDSKGYLWYCGDNSFIGVFQNSNKNRLIALKSDRMKTITGGNDFVVCLDTQGDVYVFGFNTSGQLGLPGRYARKELTKLPLKNIKSIASGHSHTICLTKAGNAIGFGNNEPKGQVGLGYIVGFSLPKRIPRLTRIIKIACCSFTSFFITSNNEVYFCGADLVQTGYARYEPYLIENIPPMRDVSCGDCHGVFLSMGDEVFVFGSNSDGQIGLNEERSSEIRRLTDVDYISHASCGSFHTILLDYNGFIYVTGNNEYGQLGLGSFTKRKTFLQNENIDNVLYVECKSSVSFFQKDDGIWMCGGGFTLDHGNFLNRNIKKPILIPKPLREKFSLSQNYAIYSKSARK